VTKIQRVKDFLLAQTVAPVPTYPDFKWPGLHPNLDTWQTFFMPGFCPV